MLIVMSTQMLLSYGYYRPKNHARGEYYFRTFVIIFTRTPTSPLLCEDRATGKFRRDRLCLYHALRELPTRILSVLEFRIYLSTGAERRPVYA